MDDSEVETRTEASSAPAEPATEDLDRSTQDESPSAPPSFDELTLAHQALMEAYVDVLKTAGWSWRSVPRRFIHSHVKGKLREISDAYRQLRQTLSLEQSAFREWLRETADECEKVAAPLASWRLPSVLAAVPGAVFALARAVHLRGPLTWNFIHIGWLSFSIYLIGYPLSLVAFVLLLGLRGFNRKRELFEEQRVYESEDALFRRMQRPKRPEALTDLSLLLASCVSAVPGMAAGLAHLQIQHHRGSSVPGTVGLSGSLLFTLVLIIKISRASREEAVKRLR